MICNRFGDNYRASIFISYCIITIPCVCYSYFIFGCNLVIYTIYCDFIADLRCNKFWFTLYNIGKLTPIFGCTIILYTSFWNTYRNRFIYSIECITIYRRRSSCLNIYLGYEGAIIESIIRNFFYRFSYIDCC